MKAYFQIITFFIYRSGMLLCMLIWYVTFYEGKIFESALHTPRIIRLNSLRKALMIS